MTKNNTVKIKEKTFNYDEVCLVKYLLTSALIEKGADPLKNNKNVLNYDFKIEHTNIKQLKNLYNKLKI